MNLKPELVESLSRIGFTKATDVQVSSIPVVLEGKDVVVRAKTGTGKTGAFLVPILQNMQHAGSVSALILTPTRELALQVSEVAEKLCAPLKFRVATVYGGASLNVQMDKLSRGVNIVVGTPGRVIDLIERGSLKINNIRSLVLDEADTMLDMGFIEDIEFIISKTPREKQTMLFSATMPKPIVDISRRYMRPNTQKIIVGEEEDLTVTSITHTFNIASSSFKYATLLAYIHEYHPKKSIIFARTKSTANVINIFLKKQGLDAILLHGGLTQAKREQSLDIFRKGAQFLIATNIAARGLDITGVTDIINFDAPDDPHTYVHRVGRSARMGKEGRAFTIFGYDQKFLVNEIRYKANIDMKEIKLNIEKYKNIEVPRYHHADRDFERGGPRSHRPQRREFNRGSGGDGRGRDRRRSGGGNSSGWTEYKPRS